MELKQQTKDYFDFINYKVFRKKTCTQQVLADAQYVNIQCRHSGVKKSVPFLPRRIFNNTAALCRKNVDDKFSK